jgi:trehalose-6-phosphate synthase
MPYDEAIGTGLKIVLELIKALNPSDLERVKKAIRKQEEENAEKMEKIKKAVVDGDVDAINALIFGE